MRVVQRDNRGSRPSVFYFPLDILPEDVAMHMHDAAERERVAADATAAPTRPLQEVLTD